MVKKIKVPSIFVSVSGGKDSQACLKYACEKYGNVNVIGLFADTRWEHPHTYRHVANMRDFYNVEIATVPSYHSWGSSVVQQVLSRGNFPDYKIRFCTNHLKIKPINEYLISVARQRGIFKVKNLPTKEKITHIVGLRGGESKNREKKYGLTPIFDANPSNYLNTPKYFDNFCKLSLPFLHYNTKDIFEYLGNDPINPLYTAGFERVGCFPCLAFNTKQQLQNCYNFDEFGAKQRCIVEELEQATGNKHVASNTGQSCLFCEVL